jgi:hypothetical protein
MRISSGDLTGEITLNGNTAIGSTTAPNYTVGDYWPWEWPQPYYPSPQPTFYPNIIYTTTTTLPEESCAGKHHYFVCDHVETCTCGKVKRVLG